VTVTAERHASTYRRYIYCFGSCIHFHIQVGEIFVETSYTLTNGGIEVRGSSTQNAQGRFIGWHELLTESWSSDFQFRTLRSILAQIGMRLKLRFSLW